MILLVNQVNCMNECIFLFLFCAFCQVRHNFKNFDPPNKIYQMITFIEYETLLYSKSNCQISMHLRLINTIYQHPNSLILRILLLYEGLLNYIFRVNAIYNWLLCFTQYFNIYICIIAFKNSQFFNYNSIIISYYDLRKYLKKIKEQTI